MTTSVAIMARITLPVVKAATQSLAGAEQISSKGETVTKLSGATASKTPIITTAAQTSCSAKQAMTRSMAAMERIIWMVVLTTTLFLATTPVTRLSAARAPTLLGAVTVVMY